MLMLNFCWIVTQNVDGFSSPPVCWTITVNNFVVAIMIPNRWTTNKTYCIAHMKSDLSNYFEIYQCISIHMESIECNSCSDLNGIDNSHRWGSRCRMCEGVKGFNLRIWDHSANIEIVKYNFIEALRSSELEALKCDIECERNTQITVIHHSQTSLSTVFIYWNSIKGIYG